MIWSVLLRPFYFWPGKGGKDFEHPVYKWNIFGRGVSFNGGTYKAQHKWIWITNKEMEKSIGRFLFQREYSFYLFGWHKPKPSEIKLTLCRLFALKEEFYKNIDTQICWYIFHNFERTRNSKRRRKNFRTFWGVKKSSF